LAPRMGGRSEPVYVLALTTPRPEKFEALFQSAVRRMPSPHRGSPLHQLQQCRRSVYRRSASPQHPTHLRGISSVPNCPPTTTASPDSGDGDVQNQLGRRIATPSQAWRLDSPLTSREPQRHDGFTVYAGASGPPMRRPESIHDKPHRSATRAPPMPDPPTHTRAAHRRGSQHGKGHMAWVRDAVLNSAGMRRRRLDEHTQYGPECESHACH